jgi:hypothetical protein
MFIGGTGLSADIVRRRDQLPLGRESFDVTDDADDGRSA